MTPWRAGTRAAALLLALAAGSASCYDSAAAGSYRGAELTPARPKPDFTLVATDGRPFAFRRATDGYLTLLFFGYTSCPDVCPVQMTNLAASLRRLDPAIRARVRVVFVTTDPDRDTGVRLRAWLDNFDPSFIGLRGSHADLARIERLFGIAPSVVQAASRADTAYTVGHAADVFAFTGDDSLRVLYPFGVRQQDWAADLPRLAAARAGPPVFVQGDIRVSNVVAPAPLAIADASQGTMAVYLTLRNNGPAPDTLVAIETPAAGVSMVHTDTEHAGMRMMMPAALLPVPPGAELRFAPGDAHVMLEQLHGTILPGSSVPLVLVFRRAGRLAVRARVISYEALDSALAVRASRR